MEGRAAATQRRHDALRLIAIVGSVAIPVLVGWQGRWAALALASFCLATAFVFHFDLSDKVERTQFVKDLAISGGLFILAAYFARATGTA